VKVDVPADGRDAAAWSAELAKEKVRVSPADRFSLRFVTHRHIGDAEVDAAIGAFANVWKKLR
jgi:threonine aldolase